MTTTIPAIETTYRGHRFRSRLEARWAVAFDRLGVRWEYEPQGYLVGKKRKPYLPDFWLPGEHVWVEVKGSNEQMDIDLMVQAALPQDGLPGTGNRQSGYDVRMLVLGPLQHGISPVYDKSSGEFFGYVGPVHAVLTARDGNLYQGKAYFTGSGINVIPEGGLIARGSDLIQWDTYRCEWGNLVGGGFYITDPGKVPDARVADALQAAMSARFEHGESGAPE